MPPTAPPGAPLLEVTDLSLGLTEGPPVVTGLTVSLAAGRVLGLVGESRHLQLGPPPPPSFINPEDLADMMASVHPAG